MYLYIWEPFVVFSVKPPHAGHPQLEARGWLHCPHCRDLSRDWLEQQIGGMATSHKHVEQLLNRGQHK
jgi:hypothetical protein